MFRKVAVALVAASLFAAPVMAETATAPAPAKAATTSSVPAAKTVRTHKTVKAHKSAKVHKAAKVRTAKVNKPAMITTKHARAHHANRMASHKAVNTGMKHARHFNSGKSGKTHKLAGTAGKVPAGKLAAAKPATRSSAN